MALTQVQSEGIGDGEVKSADLENSGVTAGTYGSSSAIPAITVDAKGRITSASTSSIDSTAITNGTSNVSVAASGDITVTRAGSTAMTFTGNGPLIPDGQELRFGTGADFRISHTGSDTILSDAGVGDVYLRNDNTVFIQNAAGTETKAEFISNGAVNLFHNNATKLATTSTGIDVTGSVTCDGITSTGVATIQGSSGQVVIKDTDSTGTSALSELLFNQSDNTPLGYIGYVSNTDSVFSMLNRQNEQIRFGTNNSWRCLISAAGHFQPYTTNSVDLGTSSARWRNIYTNDLNLSNEGGTNDVDGTWGSWTIQEGEDDLFLLNRRNGKKYKFNLTEVN